MQRLPTVDAICNCIHVTCTADFSEEIYWARSSSRRALASLMKINYQTTHRSYAHKTCIYVFMHLNFSSFIECKVCGNGTRKRFLFVLLVLKLEHLTFSINKIFNVSTANHIRFSLWLRLICCTIIKLSMSFLNGEWFRIEYLGRLAN
jgi:hypothetical protein